jgi:hypothetical protein
MKGWAAIAAVLVWVAAPAPAGAQTRLPKTPRSCHPAHATTLAASQYARVFRVRALIPSTRTRLTYGCLLSRGRPVRFHLPDFPTGYGPIALAGRYVAYGSYSDCAAGFCDPNEVVVQDLRSGRRSFVDGPLRVGEVTDLVLRATGSVAWIQSQFDETGTIQPGLQVVKAERGAAAVVLAEGTDVARGSLALARTTLYWTKAGAPASAALG